MSKVCGYVIVFVLALQLACVAADTDINWQCSQPGTWNTQNGTGWFVGLYDAGSSMQITDASGITGGSHPLVDSTTVAAYIPQAGEERLAINTMTLLVDDSAWLYTVVWNSADPTVGGYTAADWYLILPNPGDGYMTWDVPLDSPLATDYVANHTGAGGVDGSLGHGQWTAVPEPSTWALFGIGAVLVGLKARRRRARG
jgi:hypothetical protein